MKSPNDWKAASPVGCRRTLEDSSAPVLLIKRYDTANWLLDRVDGFPKNQRFIFGTRLADRTIGILELLVEATYAPKV